MTQKRNLCFGSFWFRMEVRRCSSRRGRRISNTTHEEESSGDEVPVPVLEVRTAGFFSSTLLTERLFPKAAGVTSNHFKSPFLLSEDSEQ